MECLLGPGDSWWERGEHSRRRNLPGVSRGRVGDGGPTGTKGLAFSGSGFGQEPGIPVSGVCTLPSALLQGLDRRSELALTAVR